MANFRCDFAHLTANITFAIFLCALCLHKSSCSLNLLIDKIESNRFLGIPNEIYYIQAGKVQKNALNHTVKIPENYHTIHYIWERTTSYPVRYTIDVEMRDKRLLRSVTLNVSNQGVVPNTRETVMIHFLCNGLQNTRAIVYFHLKFTLENSSVEITFKREKYCVKEAQKISFDVDQQSLIENSDSSQLKIFYIVLCSGCSLFTLLILCFLAYVFSNRKDSRQNSLHTEQQIRLRPTEPENTPYILSASAINSGTSTSSNISHSSVKKRKNYTQLDNRSMDLQDRISEITIQRRRIRLQKIELEGTFGRVFFGTYTREDGSEEDVVVKTVMDFASSNQISLLLREGLTMYGLKHKNIMSVLGVSIEDHVEPFVIYLREGFTNLKKYLQKCKLCQEGITHVLTTQEVVEIALQIISGVQYMHKKKLLHKDLAARNCLNRANYNKLVQRDSDDGQRSHSTKGVSGLIKKITKWKTPAVNVYGEGGGSGGCTATKIPALNLEKIIRAEIPTISSYVLGTDGDVEASATSTIKPELRSISKEMNAATGDTNAVTSIDDEKKEASQKVRSSSPSKVKNVTRPSVAGSKSIADGTRSPTSAVAKAKTPSSVVDSKSTAGETQSPTSAIAKSKEREFTRSENASPTLRRRSNLTGGASDGDSGTDKPADNTVRGQSDKSTPKSRLSPLKTGRSSTSHCKTPISISKHKKDSSTTSSSRPTKGPFSNPITFPPATLPPSMPQDEQAELIRRERKLEKAWRQVGRRISKTVQYPLNAPTYMKKPPVLVFEQTRTYELRRDLNTQRVAEINSRFVRSKKPLTYIEPKQNQTVNLRYKQLKKEPIFSQFFETHYNRIDSSLNVKVADNALSRDLFPSDYHCLGDNENRPVKWLAIESLVNRTFSTASDVWSFGVSLWELTTLGQQPYVEVDPFEMEHYLKDGYRLSQPVNCPDELFAVMAYCWAMSADERPTFSQLLTCLQDFRNQLNKYV